MRKVNLLQLLGIVLLFVLLSPSVYAQKEGGKFDLGADIYSRYVWRGTDFGNSPAIQPWMSYSISGFTVGVWGSYATNSNSMQEADLYISYDIKDVVTLTVTDYFFPNGTSAGNKYFEFNQDSTSHQLEASASFNGVKKFPVTFAANFNVYGFDKDNAMYFELGYGNTFKSIDWNVFLGGGTQNYYLYGENDDNFGIVNVGLGLSKEIAISEKFSLPINGSLIFNPAANGFFIVFGISL